MKSHQQHLIRTLCSSPLVRRSLPIQQCNSLLDFPLLSAVKRSSEWKMMMNTKIMMKEFSMNSKQLFHSGVSLSDSANNIGSIYIERTNIAIVGAMNSGKSTLMNCLTNSNTSIVDSTPGTTADVKMTTMELHGIGPTKLFDTPGTDEASDLGEKKRQKTLIALKESDIVVVVVDPFNGSSVQQAKWLTGECEKNERPFCIIFNVSELKRSSVESLSDKLDSIETDLKVNEFEQQGNVQMNKYFCGTTCVDLESKIAHTKCIKFIEDCHKKSKMKASSTPMYPTRLLPNLMENSTVFLNIPMDEETPSGRLLKPQAMVHEYLLREYSNVFSYRMNLKHARSSDKELVEKEKKRFLEAIKTLNSNGKLQLLITDSQAMDIVHPWTIDEATKESIIDITTFSVIMINFMSNGRLSEFLKGIEAFKALQPGDSVLLCEACNHNRIADDIGTVQIPRAIEKRFGQGNIKVDIVFGREYQLIKDLSQYKLIIHCGGCMIDKQKMNARLSDLSKAGVPITNYGLLLSFLQSEKAVSRVTKPWLNPSTPSQ
ncbi:[Fe] hydrogenase maturation protein [Naegleria gruberi]|uniref:[Fe] hydrogenase maturation protein n=1 Tax=Naegleria gruberi TaxID=5762 RepID=D2V9E8_NAEGR|nr:[Fe] hydrogenase maturation protein [Naegleria gruberi]EFC46577.1 [Fe] hydrogenase maturation protein [Naegleria gruberi]|eukprot:XP_002679321.1 [Fe] hydrogenase maturation protein [Naegleria gruberi strain NEG-M]